MRSLPRWIRGSLPLALLLPLAWASTGCVLVYLPNAAPPGRYVPPMQEGQGDFAVDIPVGRNPAYGVQVGTDDAPEPDDDQPPIWAGIDLAFRYGLTDEIGLDARITTSFILPLPFPFPNGLTAAPIFQLLEDPESGFSIHVSPRAIWSNGLFFVAGLNNDKDDTRVRTLGAELPVLFTYSPAEWFDLSGTAFVRAFYNMATLERVDNDVLTEHQASWPAFGGGATLAAILTAGRFRISLGLGLEAAPNFAASYADPGDPESIDGSVVIYPQGGLSLGAAW